MDSSRDRTAEFTRELSARLSGGGPAELAERTGLLESTVRGLLSGDFLSWEIVTACLAAADVGGDGVQAVRDRWSAAERALWDERGGALRAAFEQNGLGKPAAIADAHQPRIPFRRLTVRHPLTFEPWTEPTFPADRRLPDVSTAGDIRDLYALLSDLKTWAGSPRQSELEKRSWGTLPDATVSAMLQKDRWRSANDRERTRVGRFAAACGLPPQEVTRWVEAFDRLRHIPPPDDLAKARAEADDLREQLAAARTATADLRERLTEAEATARGQGGPARGVRRPVLAAGAALVFVLGAAAGGLAFGGRASDPVCFSGTLHLLGSTAFERTADALRRDYEARCGDAKVELDPTGSNEGVRALTSANAPSTIAMHDGHLRPDSDEIRLHGFQGLPVALIAYAVIVNKDTNLTDLPLATLRAIYTGDKGPTDWKSVRSGPSLPIRLVSRTEGSGTRTIFEERILDGPEPELSSRDCLRKDELRASARIIRCERSSQAQVLDLVDQTPGAIGYAELHLAADTARYPDLRVLALDGRRPDATPGHYPFIAPEVFYTRGVPPNRSPAAAFLTYLTTPRATRLLERTGTRPCAIPTPALAPLCR